MGKDSAVHLHLKETGNSFEDSNVHVLDGEDRLFERRVKEAIYVHLEKHLLNFSKHPLSATNTVLGAVHRQFNVHTLLGPCDPKLSHETMGFPH